MCTVRVMASAVDLLGRCANWRSKVLGREEQMWVLTNCSKRFAVIAGLYSFRQMTSWYRNDGWLNIEVNISASWLAHTLRTQPRMPSGPADFRRFTLLKALLTSAVDRDRVQSSCSSASLRNGVAHLKPCVEGVELIGKRDNRLDITAPHTLNPCPSLLLTPVSIPAHHT